MRWAILHRTSYRYAVAARDSFNEARLRPPNDRRQRLESYNLFVNPPVRTDHYTDFYGNWVDHFDVSEPHTLLELETRAVVTTLPCPIMPWDAQPATLDQARQAAQTERCFDYIQASRFTDTEPETWRMAVDATQGQTDAWQASLAIMRYVYRRMTYEPNSTHVHTHMREALAESRGVCQDFAHIMIGLCRSVQIPARYVSGYLAGQAATAMHAWMEVFIPPIGWVALDPTHDSQPDERYVKVASGRDYSDVAPLRGTYRGTTQRNMDVLVEIRSEPSDLM